VADNPTDAPRLRDAWYAVHTRNARDIAGKLVDIHTMPEMGRAFIYNLDASLSRPEMLDEVVMRLRSIREAPVKAVRQRRFNVWYGTAPTTRGAPIAAIMIPYGLDIRAWRHMSDLAQLPGELEVGAFPVRDLDGAPLARYDNGRITIYADPSDAIDGHDGDLDVRSAVIAPTGAPSRAWMLPPSGSAPHLHNMESWPANRKRILKFIWQLQEAGTYERLRQLTTERLGMSVLEDTESTTATYGRLRLGWMQGHNDAVPVGIFVRADLPSELKYVVLAHEIAHYALHFPVLHLGAMVDDLSRVVPELGDAFRTAVAQHVDAAQMEDQADNLASNFLIPPRYDLNSLATIYMEVGAPPVTAEELAWRFLRPLFPSTTEQLGWSNLADMREWAKGDLKTIHHRSPESLFERMLRAMVLRLQHRENPVDEPFMNGYLKVKNAVEDLTGLCLGNPPEEARAILARAASTSKQVSDALPADLAGDRYELRAPRVDLAGQLPQSVHLIPARDNQGAKDDGMWVDRHDPTGDIATLDGWLILVDDDVALRVYRHEAWQQSPDRT
jgi:hypothetical protein